MRFGNFDMSKVPEQRREVSSKESEKSKESLDKEELAVEFADIADRIQWALIEIYDAATMGSQSLSQEELRNKLAPGIKRRLYALLCDAAKVDERTRQDALHRIQEDVDKWRVQPDDPMDPDSEDPWLF